MWCCLPLRSNSGAFEIASLVRFFAFVVALSAVPACQSSNGAGANTGGVAGASGGEGGVGQASGASASGQAGMDAASGTVNGATSGGANGAGQGGADVSTGSGGDGGTPSSVGGAGASTSGGAGAPAGGGAGANGGSCSDSGSVTVSCDAFDSTEACSLSVQREMCDEVATFLKPRLANLARSCILALSDVEACGPGNVTDCIGDALMQSCPDPSAAAVCADLASECGGTAPSGCSPLISGLTAAGRTDLLDCVRDFCDFDDCLQGLGLL
jgi:hypothetical protein